MKAVAETQGGSVWEIASVHGGWGGQYMLMGWGHCERRWRDSKCLAGAPGSQKWKEGKTAGVDPDERLGAQFLTS